MDYFGVYETLKKDKSSITRNKILYNITPVQNKFLTALAKIGSTSYLPFSKTKPKAYVKNNSTCPNDSTVTSRKVQKNWQMNSNLTNIVKVSIHGRTW